MSLGLYLPRSAEERRRVFKCFCGTAVPLDQEREWIRHSKKCVRQHETEIDAGVHLRETNHFLAPADPELAQHILKGGT